MDWNVSWFLYGCLAFIFAIINLLRAILSSKAGSQVLLFCSLSLGGIAILSQLDTAVTWLEYEERALLETLPQMSTILAIGLFALISINLLSLVISSIKSKKKGDH